jgi:hypothetical protein
MTKKEEIYKIIDEIPEKELNSALRYLQYLRDLGEAPVIKALNSAALDEKPLSEQEANESDASWNDYLDGKDTGKTLDQFLGEVTATAQPHLG